MKSRRRVVVGLIATALHLVGLSFFLHWLGKTDFMFGHFTGPPREILAALWICAAGIAVSLVWLLTGLYGWLKAPRPAPHEQRARWFTILLTVLIILLLLPSTLAVLVGFDELPRARLKMRRGRVLSQAERHGGRGVPQLIEALEDEDPIVKQNAIVSLMKLGPEAREAVPALARTLRDATTMGGYADLIAKDAAETLGKIGPDAAPAIPALVDAVKRGSEISDVAKADDVDLVRCYASEALAKIGQAAVPALAKLLTNENPNVRYWAAKALGQMGAEAKPAVPWLVEALQDKNEVVCKAVRIATVDCLIASAQLPTPPAAGSPLDENQRFRTLRDKIPLGEISDLVALFDVKDNYVRFGAVFALAEQARNVDRLDARSKAAIVRGLGNRLKDPRERADTRLLAALTLLEVRSTVEAATHSLGVDLEAGDPLNPLIKMLVSPVLSPVESRGSDGKATALYAPKERETEVVDAAEAPSE